MFSGFTNTRINWISHEKFNIFCVGLISAFAALPIHAQITTFDYTGAMEAYAVPAGVTQIRITALGAQGGSTGGLGASMEGTFAVTPGEVLNVLVGEEGHLQVGGNFQNSAGGGGVGIRINCMRGSLKSIFRIFEISK